MGRRFVEMISGFHLQVYPYCHGNYTGALSATAVGMALVWSWCLFFGKRCDQDLTRTSITILVVAHVLVAVNWIYYLLQWGEHPVSTLCSLGGIDTILFFRQSSYGRKIRQALFVLFAGAIFVFTGTFVLTDLFPVFAVIDFAP